MTGSFGLADVIDEVAVTVDVVRTLPAPVSKGRVATAPVEKRFKISASVQPLKTKDLQLLPEGMRNAGAVKIFTHMELFSGNQAEGRLPDRIEYRGATYQVQIVDDWRDVGDYYRVIATRVTR